MVDKVTPLVEKQTTQLRKPLSVEIRLACTLRFLATGETLSSLQYQFRISKSTISLFLPKVCEAITKVLRNYMKFPSTEKEWLEISNQIFEHWQFPNS